MEKDILSKYLHKLPSKFYMTQVDNRVNEHGRDYAWNRHLEWLDCTRRFPDGSRVIQTNSHVYEVEMIQTIYLIHSYFSDLEDEKFKELEQLHEANLKHEELNPPTLVPKRKQSTPRKKNDGTSAAELKAKAKAMKIGALKFNIKHELKHE